MWWYKRVLGYWRFVMRCYELNAQLGDREMYDYASAKEWKYAKVYDKIRDKIET